jgi:hypothetical protein
MLLERSIGDSTGCGFLPIQKSLSPGKRYNLASLESTGIEIDKSELAVGGELM